jgi:hypothetical protein
MILKFSCWLRAKFDIWLMEWETFFEVDWGDADDDTQSERQDSES